MCLSYYSWSVYTNKLSHIPFHLKTDSHKMTQARTLYVYIYIYVDMCRNSLLMFIDGTKILSLSRTWNNSSSDLLCRNVLQFQCAPKDISWPLSCSSSSSLWYLLHFLFIYLFFLIFFVNKNAKNTHVNLLNILLSKQINIWSQNIAEMLPKKNFGDIWHYNK